MKDVADHSLSQQAQNDVDIVDHVLCSMKKKHTQGLTRDKKQKGISHQPGRKRNSSTGKVHMIAMVDTTAVFLVHLLCQTKLVECKEITNAT